VFEIFVFRFLNDIVNCSCVNVEDCFLLNLQMNTVIQDLIRCTVLARLSFSDRHWRVARAHAKLASAYFDIKGSDRILVRKHKICKFVCNLK
jgi:hypothetical protein